MNWGVARVSCRAMCCQLAAEQHSVEVLCAMFIETHVCVCVCVCVCVSQGI
jgi:hypothetical protein